MLCEIKNTLVCEHLLTQNFTTILEHQKYARTLKYLKPFLEKTYKVKNFAWKSIDNKFVEKYFYYLRTGRKMANNTAIKNMQFLKTLLYPAIKSGELPID